MWYFAWMLGLPLACAFAVLNAMWLELRESDVTMAVMQVGIMRMPVHQRRVPVPVRVWLAKCGVWAVLMLMMFVVAMAVFVFQGVMGVFVVVSLGQMQP